MDGLSAHEGVIEALEETVRARALPFLGICVGMQLLAETGLEHGEKAGLGWLCGICRPLQVGPFDTLPHMGWNQVSVRTDHPVLAPLAPKRHVYFCNSFVLEPAHVAILATAEHGESFCAAAGRDNIIGVQFHPEKSQAAGLALLAAFINWKPLARREPKRAPKTGPGTKYDPLPRHRFERRPMRAPQRRPHGPSHHLQ
jgi:glutamine amidotransferase